MSSIDATDVRSPPTQPCITAVRRGRDSDRAEQSLEDTVPSATGSVQNRGMNTGSWAVDK